METKIKSMLFVCASILCLSLSYAALSYGSKKYVSMNMSDDPWVLNVYTGEVYVLGKKVHTPEEEVSKKPLEFDKSSVQPIPINKK